MLVDGSSVGWWGGGRVGEFGCYVVCVTAFIFFNCFFRIVILLKRKRPHRVCSIGYQGAGGGGGGEGVGEGSKQLGQDDKHPQTLSCNVARVGLACVITRSADRPVLVHVSNV